MFDQSKLLLFSVAIIIRLLASKNTPVLSCFSTWVKRAARAVTKTAETE